MGYEIKIKNKVIDINFNYSLMFKVQKELGTVNKETGERNNDGVGALFSSIASGEDTGLFKLINLCKPKALKLTDDDILEGIQAHVEELDDDIEVAYNQLFENIKEEMVDSGFFRKKLSDYIKSMKRVLQLIEEEDDKESQMQKKVILEQIGEMEKALSLEPAQD